VIGATVTVKGTTTGVITGINGDYNIQAPPDGTLTFSFLGMSPVDVAINGRARLDVRMATGDQELQEVVVTALGITREKKALGYSVSEVGGDAIIASRGGTNNPINALQGRVAGLNIASNSGSMGGSSKILIRGVNSLSGNNQPLFVIDGVPVEGTDYNDPETARGAEGFDYGNLIQDINPDDIENISVLKGPNAAALYGSRAANGVIMVTTKRGGGGNDKSYHVSVNSSVGFERVNKLPVMQRLYGGGYGGDFEQVTIGGKTYNYPDYATDESWGPKYEGQDILSWYDIAKWEAGGKVGNPTTSKWQAPAHDIDDFFETGVSFTNNVSISQATDAGSIRLSYTNSDLKGYMPNSSLKKNIFNVAASTKSYDKKLELFTTMTYFNSRAEGRSEQGYGDNNVMVKFVQWGHRELDMAEAKDLYQMPDGTQATWNRSAWDDPTPAYSNNPYWSRYKNYQNDSRNRIYGNAGVSYLILPSLKFQYKANLDFFVDKQYERSAVYSQELSSYKEISRQQYEMNHEFMLSFNKTFGDFSLAANAGANLMSRKYEYVFGETQGGIAIPEFYNLKNSITPAQAENLQRRKAINSIYGSATLGWRGMLYVDATLRNDKSSALPSGNNSYLYPAVTGSFIFSELTKGTLSWLSLGKVRAGYAFVGNDTDPYQVIDTYPQYTNIDPSAPGYILDIMLKNKDLKPESTKSFEVGLELSFLNNRIGFDATYYSNKTENQIIPLSLSGSTGYREKVVNSGLISNKGFEFTFYATPLRIGGFEWETNLTLASNKNKVEKLVEGTSYYRLVNAPFRVEIGAVEGAEYGAIMGTDFIYDSDGNKVIAADGTYAATNGNVNLGSVFPDFTGGWGNTFRYKNFDLNILFDFSKGGHFFSTSYMWGMYSGMIEESAAGGIRENGIVLTGVTGDVNVKADGTYSVTNTAPNTTVIDAQTYGESFYTSPAAMSVLKTDYFKLREISIGYTFPLGNNRFVKGLRLSAYGRNLAVWGPATKHFDPEVATTNSGNIQGIEGGIVPSVATFGFNIGLNF
jgi:TonB-linked SusC/RagA family outer membrane protein